jgi:sugar phosphate isomerase/epimerase
VKVLTDEQKKKAIELAQKMGLIVTFTNETGIFVTDGHSREKIEWENVFPELEKR